MNWQTLAWTVVGDEGQLGVTLRKDLADAVAAHVNGEVALAEVATASASGAALPPGFDTAATFMPPGAAPFGAWLALDPAGGHVLGGQTLEPATLARLLGEAVDTTFRTSLGASLDPRWEGDGGPAKDARLVLVRLRFRDADGLEVMPVAALPADAVEALSALVGTPVAAGPSVASEPSAPAVRPLAFGALTPLAGGGGSNGIDVLLGVNLRVTVEIGRTELPIRDVLAWTPGSIVELDKLAGEKVDVLVNGHRIALGEVVVVDDNFGVRVTDVVATERAMIPAAVRG